MKKLIYLTATIFLFTITLLSGCAVEGCTDPDADNYNPDATVDDYSCQYTGHVVFWYDYYTSQVLQQYDAQIIYIYLDGQYVGAYYTTTYFTVAPDCYDYDAVTAMKYLGYDKYNSYHYEVIDDDGYTWWDGYIDVSGNTCMHLQLSISKDRVINK